VPRINVTITAGTVEELRDRAKRWAAMLAAAIDRGDYSAARGYAHHLELMAAELRRVDGVTRLAR
jgi:hypothetical protein